MGTLYWTNNGPSAEDFAIATPRIPDPSKPPIIFCPQAGGQAEFFLDPTTGDKTERSKMFHHLARDGFVCATSDFGGANLWGNDNATGRVKQVYDYLQTLSTVKHGAALMVGTSMGNVTALSFARRYPGTVKGVLSLFGACDTAHFYADPSFKTAIQTAWGVVYPAPLPDQADPMTFYDELVGLPWRGWTAADDPLVGSQGEVFANLLGASAKHTTVADGGHSDLIFAHLDYETDLKATLLSMAS